MIGLGTLVNGAAVIAGGLFGLLFKGGLKQRFQDIVMQALGLSVVFIGVSGVLQQMFVIADTGLDTKGTMLLVISLVLGAVLGEVINLHKHTERLGEWLKVKFKSQNDNGFVEGFVSASLTICIGAMAIVGALEDGLSGDHTTLFTKALLDGFIVLIFASVFGKGAIFSAVPVMLLQGSVTLLAQFIAPYITDAAIGNLSLVGSALIFCVGTNLLFKTKIKVANLLPALLFVFLYGLFFY
ncbi:MAG: DUF554 domain-containing protein [Oscillospiraceae bacterium]|jgi:uncharacterized membrane protein YqgA involved in biofilm formation|nr:DUF554 domain-containing protein [Oscillospiraceae bacterium]